jgi:hypothetical protein
MLDALVSNVLPEPKLCSGLIGIRRFVIQCFVSVASEVSVLFGAARSIHRWICCKRPVSPVPSWPGDDVRVNVLPGRWHCMQEPQNIRRCGVQCIGTRRAQNRRSIAVERKRSFNR